MELLDNPQHIEKFDKSHSLESIDAFADQCKGAWYEASKLGLPDAYKKAESIVFCAMGGSAYAARIIQSAFFHTLKLPVDIVNDYHLPRYVNERTLIMAASYSGGTEETISCIRDAFTFDPMIIGISSGGELHEIMDVNLKPCFTFTPTYNPSMQPRLGQGYMIMGQLALLNSLGYISIANKEIEQVIAFLRVAGKTLNMQTPTKNNPAKQTAKLFENKIVNLVGAEFLTGAIHAIRNPIHETGKHLASYHFLPEMNHHFLEGLSYPKEAKNLMLFVLIHSLLYSEPIRKRLTLTKDVVDQNGIGTHEIKLHTQSKLMQVFELIQLGSYISFYLAMLHGVEPSKIPWVDYFKAALSEKR